MSTASLALGQAVLVAGGESRWACVTPSLPSEADAGNAESCNLSVKSRRKFLKTFRRGAGPAPGGSRLVKLSELLQTTRRVFDWILIYFIFSLYVAPGHPRYIAPSEDIGRRQCLIRKRFGP